MASTEGDSPQFTIANRRDFLLPRLSVAKVLISARCAELSGMFRRSASLALPHLKSFAAIPSVSLVQLGHTNRSVFLSHESQREITLPLV